MQISAESRGYVCKQIWWQWIKTKASDVGVSDLKKKRTIILSLINDLIEDTSEIDILNSNKEDFSSICEQAIVKFTGIAERIKRGMYALFIRTIGIILITKMYLLLIYLIFIL